MALRAWLRGDLAITIGSTCSSTHSSHRTTGHDNRTRTMQGTEEMFRCAGYTAYSQTTASRPRADLFSVHRRCIERKGFNTNSAVNEHRVEGPWRNSDIGVGFASCIGTALDRSALDLGEPRDL